VRHIRTIVFLTGIALSSSAWSVVQVIGTGQLGCGEWLQAREKNDEVRVEFFVQWIWGFLTSHDYYQTSVASPRVIAQQMPSHPTVTAYIDKYCKEHPLNTVLFGAAQLAQDLGGITAFHNRKPPKQ
jgi:hypothetical protein